MVIEVLDVDTLPEQGTQRDAICVDRYIQHRHGIAWPSRNTAKQPDLPLDAGDQRGRNRVRQSQLVQRANSVCVTVEDVEVSHALPPNREREAPRTDCAPRYAFQSDITRRFSLSNDGIRVVDLS